MLNNEDRDLLHNLYVYGGGENIFTQSEIKKLVNTILPSYLMRYRWFGGKSKIILEVKIVEHFSIQAISVHLFFISVSYSDEQSETYLLPIAYIQEKDASLLIEQSPMAVICRINSDGILYDAFYNDLFRGYLLNLITKHKKIKGQNINSGFISSQTLSYMKIIKKTPIDSMKSTLLDVEQSNTSILYDNKLILKLFRRLEEGINPELEIVQFLTEKTGFKNVPFIAGTIQYDNHNSEIKEQYTLGILSEYIIHQDTAWSNAEDELNRFFKRVLGAKAAVSNIPHIPYCLSALDGIDIPEIARELIGGEYLETARLIGKRTAQLHLALLSQIDNPVFSREPFSLLYQISLYQSILSRLKRSINYLNKNTNNMPDKIKPLAHEIIDREPQLTKILKNIYKNKIEALKIRIHGDYHLGQLLYTGRDFVIIDFEGEPRKSISQRKRKRSPLVDAAGMIRSFHYAAYSVKLRHTKENPANTEIIDTWADIWFTFVAGEFIKSYVNHAVKASLVPKDISHLKILLNTYIIEKAVYEIEYELSNRPAWVEIPLYGLKSLIDALKEQ